MNLDFPKAELHLHLEGSIEPATLRELARRHHLPAADFSEDELAARYGYDDFLGFLEAFKWVTHHLRTPEDYELIAYRLLQKLHRQHVRYAEIYYSAGINLWKKQEVRPIVAGLDEARRRAEQDFGIRVQWIFDAVRHFGPAEAEQVARLAIELRACHVVGIGIGGDEARGEPKLFQRVYEMARAEGLRLTAHAGETTGPSCIWETIEHLKAERIGHGVSAVQDAALVKYLAEEQIPVEVCVTSNYATGAVAAGMEHPVRRLFEAGVLVVINSDDPPMFHTTLNQEYARLAEQHGFQEPELRELARNSFRAAFLSRDEKAAFLRELPY